ncbi:MAG: class I SAM-dependent methyltransferase [Bauldia sp.]|nr:class I SAM-dependent methyltransferase [Bauldia sp.]
MHTWIQRWFAPAKRWLPRPVMNAVRSTVTATFTPYYTSIRSGHFRSSFAMKAVDRKGRPLPWYTYPSIDFLRQQGPYTGRSVLEFGGGQSSLWWASNGATVLVLEGDAGWAAEVQSKAGDLPITLKLVSQDDIPAFQRDARAVLEGRTFDIIVVDGLFRRQAAELALDYLAPDGAIVCDDSEGYELFDALKDSALRRVDFYGNAPGVVLSHCTSIWFREGCALFDNTRRPVFAWT